jgi:hypothetical protein
LEASVDFTAPIKEVEDEEAITVPHSAEKKPRSNSLKTAKRKLAGNFINFKRHFDPKKRMARA